MFLGPASGHARTGVGCRPAEDASHSVAAAGQAGKEDGQLLDSAVSAAAGAAAAVQSALARQAAIQGAAPCQQWAANEKAERGRLHVAWVAGSASLSAKRRSIMVLRTWRNMIWESEQKIIKI